MMMMTSLKKGDRVEYVGANDLGFLKPGASGLVVELYPQAQIEIWGEDALTAAVAWPSLREHMPKDAAPIVIEGLDMASFHEGDVVPMMDRELKVTGNVYDEGY